MPNHIESEHIQMVLDLAKSGEDILRDIDAEQMHCLHMAVGVAGESGELLDAIKKFAIYQRLIDIDNVMEELGDLEFYMQGLREALGIDRNETLRRNLAKLRKRYSNGYSNQAAQERADKQNQSE